MTNINGNITPLAVIKAWGNRPWTPGLSGAPMSVNVALPLPISATIEEPPSRDDFIQHHVQFRCEVVNIKRRREALILSNPFNMIMFGSDKLNGFFIWKDGSVRNVPEH
jgi:hypothetical protein